MTQPPSTARAVPSPLTNSFPAKLSVYSSVALAVGELVYVSGWNAANSCFAVTKADADVAGKPAQFVVIAQLTAAGVASVTPLDQTLTGILDTSGGSVGDPVYLSTTAGAMTLTAPTGAARVQIVGYVSTVSATAGVVQLVPQVYAQNKELASVDFQGPLTVTSNSANALAVGANGTTNPVLKIDAATASVATGISVTGAAAAGGVAVAVISSGTNESVTFDAKGSGTVTINGTGTGNVIVGSALAFGSDASAAKSIIIGTTNGLKIGTAAAQKIGFFNATPVVQQTKAGHNNWAMVSDVVSALVNLGLFDQN